MNSHAFNLQTKPDGIATLTFDLPGSSANIFNHESLMELGAQIDQLSLLPHLKGLILASGKPSIFIAGADLKTLEKARDSELSELIKLGQSVFTRLAALSVPTVAAIHGACVGGGLELALACDWRVASDSPKTRLGLPETQLGILPAWGGTTRLTRLLGLPTALPMILSGKLFKGASARHKGLVDELVPEEFLLTTAQEILSRGKRPRPHFRLLHNPLAIALIRRSARRKLLAQSRGHYPAPLTALQVACQGIRRPLSQSLQLEHDAILELAPREETHNLMRLFSLSEHARKMRIDERTPRPIRHAAVIGAGVMGSGIAYWLSTRGIKVLLQDISDEALAQGMQRIETLYRKATEKRVFSKIEMARGLDRVVPMQDQVPLLRCDLIIEAATEDLAVKKEILRDLALRAGPHTIFATNTSALPLQALTEQFPHPERLVGLHFFNPVHRMRLVEVVKGQRTDRETLAQAVGFVQQIGKLPVLVEDRPGFLVNRILMPYLMKAGDLFAQGGDPVTIDSATLAFGMPMGPLRLLDEVGLDIALEVAKTLSASFPDRMSTPEVLVDMTDRGLLGRKVGKGFYLYDSLGPRPNPEALSLQGSSLALPDNLGEHLARTMIAEALVCLREGVTDSADDLDLAMILGTGFPAFRGGPVTCAQALGLLRPPRTAEAHPFDFSPPHHHPSVIV